MTNLFVFLESPVGEAAARSLLHFLWQGALLGLAAAITLRALERSSPQVRYAAACSFLLAMALLPAVTFAYLTSQATSAPGIALTADPVQPVATGSNAVSVPNSSWLTVVLALWVAGVVVCSVRAAGGWALAIYRLSAKRKEADLAVRAAASTIAGKLGIRRAVRVYESSLAVVPAVFGAIRPVIVLPVSAATGLPVAHLEAILAHELAHIVRHDFLVNCIQTVVEVMLFYHPAVWWLSRRIRQEREICCDAMAAEMCGDRVMYSRALLALEEGRQEFALAATGGDLKSRIERLLHPSAQRRTPELTTFVSALLITAALLMGAAAITVRAQEKRGGDSPYVRWANEHTAYLIRSDERRRWDALVTDAEREQFIIQFWELRDPTPGTSENEMKVEHYRRISYTNGRFSDSRPGWATARGRIYIVNGPPYEIESHPRDLREVWRYLDGREFEFNGAGYELTAERPAAARAPGIRIIERISVDRLPEPQRRYLGERLARFAGQPMSNDLMDQIRAAAADIDRTLTYRWSIDKVTGNGSLELSREGMPAQAR